ncbi:MAG: class I SAM-dependent methyltransferase [Candidatus Thorarchaeota archaeon]|jgi:ubiquinone/menaquinone biosynthesis C-methylase UbiE
MNKAHLRSLRCPKCRKKLQIVDPNAVSEEFDEGSLACEKGHTWSVSRGMPSLVHPPISEEDAKWISDYDEMAEVYDEQVKQYDEWLGIDLMKERQQMAQLIPIEGPVKIIDVSIGTGANFMALAELYGDKMGRFNLHGLDLSTGMLEVSRRKATENNLAISLVHGSVFNIPYVDSFFDIVIHSGGINTFSDIPGALNEMLRIVRSAGIVIVVDEGVSPKARKTERGKKIIEANSLFGATPPLEHIPDGAKDVEITYVMNDTFYQIVFRK